MGNVGGVRRHVIILGVTPESINVYLVLSAKEELNLNALSIIAQKNY